MAELVWEGKYRDVKRVAPVRIELPFQTVETVNESAQDRKRNLDLFAAGKKGAWRNRLIWGDKKYVLPNLLAEFAGEVDLVYSAPPFGRSCGFPGRQEADRRHHRGMKPHIRGAEGTSPLAPDLLRSPADCCQSGIEGSHPWRRTSR